MIYLLASALLLAAMALARWRTAESAAGADALEPLRPWIPSIAFALANAAAFALHADAVSPRYTVPTHAMWMATLYATAWRRIRA